IGEILIKNHPVIIIDKKDLEFKLLGLFRILKIDGIIGWNAVQNMDLEIDYRNKVSVIKKPERIESHKRNFFWLGYPIVKLINKESIELLFGLDTGAKNTSIRNNIFKKISNNNVTVKNTTLGSAGGFEEIETKEISDFTLILNNYTVYFQNIKTHPVDGTTFVKLDGFLGSDIFKNGKIKIDYLNGIFEFKN
ncbi:MAG: hypothetical protein K8R68_11415, partial [Bacteroidales bacterium]|nr:hypothetical protein [Bacteroidales bacterium]